MVLSEPYVNMMRDSSDHEASEILVSDSFEFVVMKS